MKFDTPKNENYAAVILRVSHIKPIPKRDRIESIPLYGHNAVVAKGWNVGDLGVFFPAEVQLSEQYARENNMHRHGDRNADPGQSGYLEDSRRVKAIKLGDERSNALFMPLSSLASFGVKPEDFREGDTFDTLNGQEVCRKYVVREPGTPNNQAPKDRSGDRVDRKVFPEHIDTSNYWRSAEKVAGMGRVVVTQKLHGTSIRVGRVPVRRSLSRLERLAARFGVRVQTHEYASVYGSRKVIKDANTVGQNHFYAQDIWTQKGRELDGILPDGWIAYGELIGWTPDGAPIQKGYTYELPPRQSKIYIYRIAVVNASGVSVDLSQSAMVEFCKNHGLNYVPVLWAGNPADFRVDDWMDQNYANAGFTNAVAAGNGVVDEGVVVRGEGLAPVLLKAKAPQFLEHETSLLDNGTEDLESAEAAQAA
ncbi:RNA ligase family protein [Nocardia salmonicida]|uniref:RNA ligase family protein n=1 Tax=Nocardia salmonicida TaxID=53431 RepID=UPI0033CEAB95